MKLVISLIFTMLLAGCGPSCEEQGGIEKLVGGYVQFITIGTITTPIWQPVFECEFQNNDREILTKEKLYVP